MSQAIASDLYLYVTLGNSPDDVPAASAHKPPTAEHHAGAYNVTREKRQEFRRALHKIRRRSAPGKMAGKETKAMSSNSKATTIEV